MGNLYQGNNLDWNEDYCYRRYHESFTKKKSRTFIHNNHHSCYLHVFTYLLLGVTSNLKQFSRTVYTGRWYVNWLYHRWNYCWYLSSEYCFMKWQMKLRNSCTYNKHLMISQVFVKKVVMKSSYTLQNAELQFSSRYVHIWLKITL